MRRLSWSCGSTPILRGAGVVQHYTEAPHVSAYTLKKKARTPTAVVDAKDHCARPVDKAGLKVASVLVGIGN